MTALLVIVWPLALATLLMRGGWTRVVVSWILPLAALPALALALARDVGQSAEIPWLILGAQFGLAGGGPVFLFLTAFLWTIAGWYAPAYLGNDPGLRRYSFFYLLTLAGNVGLVLAEDVPGFYACFALMTFAAYGLVVHDGSPAARRAGRVYIVVAVFGEALLLAALFLAVDAADSWRLQDLGPAVAQSEQRHAIIPLALFGFGAKAGLLPLHFWLPLAHPVAPTPASALLSGAMIKAGLLGWMHVLPLGEGDFVGWGFVMIALGLVAAFYGVVCGLAQSDPKANLAYSSISQMGIMTMGVGAGLSAASTWPAMAAAVSVYALNHALAKGTLFLGVGVSAASRGTKLGQRVLVLSALAFAASVIAGAPLLGGALAKDALKYPATAAIGETLPWLGLILSLSAVATTLLLGRFLLLIAADMRTGKAHHAGRSVWLAWSVGLAGTAAGVTFAMRYYAIEVHTAPRDLSSIWSSAWPLLTGAALVWLMWSRTRKRRNERQTFPFSHTIPAGDIIVPIERATQVSRRIYERVPGPKYWQLNLVPLVDRIAKSRPVQDFFNHFEIRLKRWETAGVIMLVLLLTFWISLG